MGLLAERKHDPEKQEGARVLPTGAAPKLPEDGCSAQKQTKTGLINVKAT